MQTLQLDPSVPFVVPPLEEVTIGLIGCGGTGSHIAQSLARLASHCESTNGPRIQLVFVDGDTVEAKNVGRQLFSAADVGKNKAQALAGRFGAVFGLNIVAFPHMLQTGTRIANPYAYGILIGAVDSAAGRRAIAGQLGGYNWKLWIDCGNHEHSGQVVVGNTLTAVQMRGAIQLGMCAKLPAAPLLYPELLKDAVVQPYQDCARAMEDNAQSLMVNQAMAAIASQYAYRMVIQRRLTTFHTSVDLESLSMRSTPITAAQLAQACGMSADDMLGITAKKPKKQRRAA
jgi:PRTRC genetic system ThiF family protein